MSGEKDQLASDLDTGKSKDAKGDSIKIGSIGSMTGSVIGSGKVEAGLITSGDTINQQFQSIYLSIENRPEDPDVEKEELIETINKIEQEAAKGVEANPNKVERWLHHLGEMAPDILDVTTACLISPVTGIATVIRKVAEKARDDARSANAQV